MEKVKLSKYIKQIRGVSYKPEDVTNELDKNAIPILRANNITADGHIDLNDIVYVKSQKVQSEQLLRAGDIFICASSGSKNLVGKAVYIPTDMPYAFGAFCKVVRPISENIDKHYLAQFFQSPAYRKKISDLAQGANINNIKNEHIDELDIAIYSLEEQKAIAERLDKVSELIEKRKQQLEKLDLLIKSRFIEMFGDRGKNPHNFSTTTMGDVYKFQYGKGNNIPEDKGEYLCYGSNGVVGHHTEYNSEDSPIIGHIGAYAGIVNWGQGKHYVTYNGVICKLINEQVNPIYGYYLLQIQDYNAVAKSGAAQPFISYKDLDAPIVNIPPFEFQNQFATFVEQVDKSKFEIQKSLEKLETLKKSLMQQYFG